MGDAAPAIDSFSGGLGEVLLSAAGEDGGDAADAEFGGLFDGPLEVIELEDGEQEVQGEVGFGFELFVEGEDDADGRDGGDLGAMEEAAGNEIVNLAGLGAEDAGEVCSLVAGEGGGVVIAIPDVGDETAASHEVSLLAGWFSIRVKGGKKDSGSLRADKQERQTRRTNKKDKQEGQLKKRGAIESCGELCVWGDSRYRRLAGKDVADWNGYEFLRF